MQIDDYHYDVRFPRPVCRNKQKRNDGWHPSPAAGVVYLPYFTFMNQATRRRWTLAGDGGRAKQKKEEERGNYFGRSRPLFHPVRDDTCRRRAHAPR